LFLQDGISSENVAFAMISGNLVKADEQEYTLLSTSTVAKLSCVEKVPLICIVAYRSEINHPDFCGGWSEHRKAPASLVLALVGIIINPRLTLAIIFGATTLNKMRKDSNLMRDFFLSPVLKYYLY
jgi:hypothetical protein